MAKMKGSTGDEGRGPVGRAVKLEYAEARSPDTIEAATGSEIGIVPIGHSDADEAAREIFGILVSSNDHEILLRRRQKGGNVLTEGYQRQAIRCWRFRTRAVDVEPEVGEAPAAAAPAPVTAAKVTLPPTQTAPAPKSASVAPKVETVPPPKPAATRPSPMVAADDDEEDDDSLPITPPRAAKQQSNSKPVVIPDPHEEEEDAVVPTPSKPKSSVVSADPDDSEELPIAGKQTATVAADDTDAEEVDRD